MHRPSTRVDRDKLHNEALWQQLIGNLEELQRQCEWRGCPPERRGRTKGALEAARILHRRGTQVLALDPSEGRASRNAILGWDD